MEDESCAVATTLEYAPPRKGLRLRRWLGPGSAGFNLLILVVAGAGVWQSWKWHLEADEKAYKERVEELNWYALPWIGFKKPPNAAALRHLARRPGPVTVCLGFDDSSDDSAARAFRDGHWPNITELMFGEHVAVDAWLKEMARPDSGLTSVTRVDLHNTQVTGAGLKELARPDVGLSALRTLDLYATGVTDADIRELSRTDSGLRSLTTLILWLDPVTDAGVKELARADSGLRSLTSLNLCWTEVTDAGLRELARPESGLSALTTLNLSHTKVTDAGLKELAGPEGGLKALGTLDLSGTKATAAGIADLKNARPGLKIAL